MAISELIASEVLSAAAFGGAISRLRGQMACNSGTEERGWIGDLRCIIDRSKRRERVPYLEI